ncbi:hypothetical protein N0V94_005348 [Neodidymelliopsis sp. IMI 364377]|nr:hypothetical protein N0V94_005348 [Neodidymelliopsis sp. IMI 364377]
MSSSNSANKFSAAEPSPSDNLPDARLSSSDSCFVDEVASRIALRASQEKNNANLKKMVSNLKQSVKHRNQQLVAAHDESARLREKVQAAKDRTAQLEEELRVARLQRSKELEVMRTTFETVNNDLRNEIQHDIESLRMEVVKGSGTAQVDKNLLHREFDRLKNKVFSIGSTAVEFITPTLSNLAAKFRTNTGLANLNNDSRVGLVAVHRIVIANQREATKRSREEEAESSSNSKRPRLESVEGLQAEPFADDEAGGFDLADNGGDNDSDNDVSASPCRK